MGAKRTNRFTLMNAVALSATNTVNSATQTIENVDNIFIQIRFAGTMTGTLKVQASVDGILWDDFVFSPALAQPAGSALAYAISLNQIPAAFFRITYTNVSGTGTLTASFFSKDLN